MSASPRSLVDPEARSRARGWVVAGLLLLGPVGCMQRAPATTPSSRELAATSAWRDGLRGDPLRPTVARGQLGAACEGVITEAGGCVADEGGASPPSFTEAIAECHGERGGKVRILVREVDGRVELDVEPGATLDPTSRTCILDALATVDLDESTSPSSNVSLRPHGFTSALTVDW